MPLLVILFLTAACLPVRWPEPPFDGIAELTLAFVVTALAGSAALSRWASRHPHLAVDTGAYSRWRRRLFFFHVFGTAACVGLGWGATVQTAFAVWHGDEWLLAPFAEVFVPGPYLAIVMANWVVYYPAERAIHRAFGESDRFWSVPGFVLFHARQFALVVLLPVFMIAGQRSVSQFLPATAQSWWYQLASVGVVVLLFLFLPLLARPVLGLTRLPAGDTRDELRATARRLGFRSELLLWPTRNAVANAMVLGYVPFARFVVFTDKLLATLGADERDAVFGHEVGHARHGHLPYYAGFFVLSMLAVSFGLSAAAEVLFGPTWAVPGGWEPLLMLAALAGHLFVVFGFLSRVCERQADIDGARAVSCGDPACHRHTRDTPLAVGFGPVCGTGARTMARALERVVLSAGEGDAARTLWRRVNAWLKAWQHGPAAARVEFLYRLAERPQLADRHDRFAFRVRVGIAVALVAAVAVSGSVLGWAKVWKML